MSGGFENGIVCTLPAQHAERYNANTNIAYGISLAYSSNNNTVSGNNASNNAVGIYLSSSSSINKLISNIASNNSYYGIFLDSSSSNIIYNNFFNNTNNFGSSVRTATHGILPHAQTSSRLLFRWQLLGLSKWHRLQLFDLSAQD
jgi:parallel beta-helix repeat protein